MFVESPSSHMRGVRGVLDAEHHRSLQTSNDGFLERSQNHFVTSAVVVGCVIALSIVIVVFNRSRRNFLEKIELARSYFVTVNDIVGLEANGWPSKEPELDQFGYPPQSWIQEFGTKLPPRWRHQDTRGGERYTGALHGISVNPWNLNVLTSNNDADALYWERRLILSYAHVLNSMLGDANKARWGFAGDEGVDNRRAPVARNSVQGDVDQMMALKQIYNGNVWFDGAHWPKFSDPETAANGLLPYVLEGSIVGVHVATPSPEDYGTDSFQPMSQELKDWFDYVTGLRECAQLGKEAGGLDPGYWPIIYHKHERYWMLAEACAGILHGRIDFMPDSKRRVADMICTLNYLVDPKVEYKMYHARAALDAAASTWYAGFWGFRRTITNRLPHLPPSATIRTARLELFANRAAVARWAALIGGVKGRRPKRAVMTAFLEPMATAELSKQSDRIPVFAMLAYLFEHVYACGLGPMEALMKYENEDDKLYKAWECMCSGRALPPDGYTSLQIYEQERRYALRTIDDNVSGLHVRIGARFSMPVRLPRRGFMGSMSITPWKPQFVRALWRCRGLVKEVDDTPRSNRDDRVENGSYTILLDADDEARERYGTRMRYLNGMDAFITRLQKWYLPVVSSDLPWCWDSSTRLLLVPIIDMRSFRDMLPMWSDGGHIENRVLRVQKINEGIFPRVNAGIDSTFDLSSSSGIWQFAFRIPKQWVVQSPNATPPRRPSRNYVSPERETEPSMHNGEESSTFPGEQVCREHPRLVSARLAIESSLWGVHSVMSPSDIDRLDAGVNRFDQYVEGPIRHPVQIGVRVSRDGWSDVRMINKAPMNMPRLLHGLPANADSLYETVWTGEDEHTEPSEQGWLGTEFPTIGNVNTGLLWAPTVEWH